MSAGASPQTPLRNLQRSPRLPSWFQGDRFAAAGNGGEGREGLGGGGRGEGRGKGEVGEIAPCLLLCCINARHENYECFVCYQTCDHIVTLDLDTLIHITKYPGRKHRCYVYRLDRSLPDEDVILPPPTKRRRRLQRRSTEDFSSLTDCDVLQWHPAVTVYQFSR